MTILATIWTQTMPKKSQSPSKVSKRTPKEPSKGPQKPSKIDLWSSLGTPLRMFYKNTKNTAVFHPQRTKKSKKRMVVACHETLFSAPSSKKSKNTMVFHCQRGAGGTCLSKGTGSALTCKIVVPSTFQIAPYC